MDYIHIFIKNLQKTLHADLRVEFLEKFQKMVQQASTSFRGDLRSSYIKVIANLKENHTKVDLSVFFEDLDCTVRQSLITNLYELYDIMDKHNFTETFFSFCQREHNIDIVKDIGKSLKPLFEKIFLTDFHKSFSSTEKKNKIIKNSEKPEKSKKID